MVWQAYQAGSVAVLARPLAGGPVKTLWSGRSAGPSLAVEGDVVTFEARIRAGYRNVVYLRISDPAGAVRLGRTNYSPSLSHGKIAYQDRSRTGAGKYEYSTRVIDVATGEDKLIQQAAPGTSLGPTAITGEHVFWLLDEVDLNGTTALRRAAFDGSGSTDLSPETGPQALNIRALTASEEAVTMEARTPVPEYRNEYLAKLWQFSPAPNGDGLRKSRVSCNQGEQLSAAAASGPQVLWLDATTGISDVVTRTRPADRCD